MTQPPHVTIHHSADGTPASEGATGGAAMPKGKIRDAKGRMLEVRPLNALETYRLMKITKATGGEGFFGMAAMAAAVRSIDGEPEAYINTDREIEVMIQRLGNEGLAAVAEVLSEKQKEEIGEAPKS
jgi:hypothetical protein